MQDGKRDRETKRESPVRSVPSQPVPAGDVAATKGVERRPDLAAETSLPPQAVSGMEIFCDRNAACTETAVSSLVSVIRELMKARTPDQRLRLLSRVSEAVSTVSRDVPHATCIDDFVLHVACPVLYDAGSRYLHKGLLNVLRRHIPDTAKRLVPGAWGEVLSTFADALGRGLSTGELTLDHNIASSIDACTVLVVPAFLSEFQHVAAAVVPPVEILLRRSVAAALDTNGASVPSHALEHLRFVIRTVTGVLHKFFSSIWRNCRQGPAQRRLVTVFEQTARLLLDVRIPKDLLNAAGLLVSNFIVLDDSAPQLLRSAVLCARRALDKERQQAQQQVEIPDMQAFFSSAAPSDRVSCLSTGLEKLTPNGALALLKGILSSTTSAASSEVRECLLLPPDFLLYDAILLSAVHWCSRADVPDTRFVAIQTLDAAVRFCKAALSRNDKSESLTLPMHIKRLESLLNEVTDIVLLMWDDPTQRVAGGLYETFAEVLETRQCLASCDPDASPAKLHEAMSKTCVQTWALADDRRAKYQALTALLPRIGADAFIEAAMQQETSGSTVHSRSTFALAVMPRLLQCTLNSKVSNLIGELICALAKSMLGPSMTHANSGSRTVVSAAVDEWLAVRTVVLTPIAAACRRRSEEPAIAAGTVAHVVLPLLRAGAFNMLSHLLETTLEAPSDEGSLIWTVSQFLLRARSAGVSIDQLTSTTNPDGGTLNGRVAGAVSRALTVADNDLRLGAFELLCLEHKGAAPLQDAQCTIFKEFVDSNMSAAVDSVFRGRLLTITGKWASRVSLSVSGSCKTPSAEAAAYATKVLRQSTLVLDCLVHKHLDGAFSSERKLTALCIIEQLANAVISSILGDANACTKLREGMRTLGTEVSLTTFLPRTLGDVVCVCLESGWDKLRIAARAVGELLARHDAEDLQKRLLSGSALPAWLESPRLPQTEGGVARVALLSLLPRAEPLEIQLTTSNVAVVLRSSHAENLCQISTCVCDVLDRLVSDLANGLRSDAVATWKLFAKNPLHGLLAVLGDTVKRLDARSQSTSSVVESSANIASRVLETVTTLVGQESGSDTVVDCRGHLTASGTGAPQESDFETTMRVVVNNSWLAAKAACELVQQLSFMIGKHSGLLSPKSSTELGNALMAALLRSKHNGVISRCRNALKSLSCSLLRQPIQAFASIPAGFLEELLGEQGVESSEVSRMLRRSQGLPHAVLPILEAEDGGSLCSLTEYAMMRLLRAAEALETSTGESDSSEASGGGSAGLGAKKLVVLYAVNALNVLKFIFDDSYLAPRVTVFLERALMRAANGFRHPDWFVRNSSLMLFTSVVRRLIGDHQCNTSSTLFELLKRAPAASHFIAEGLKTAASRSSTNELQPETYPLLLATSFLRPDAPQAIGCLKFGPVVDPAAPEAGKLTHSLVQTCIQCLSMPNLMVRAAASNALLSLVPHQHFGELFDALAPSATAHNTHALHGVILTLHKAIRVYVGWEHDGTDHKRPCEGLKIRDSHTTSATVVRTVTSALLPLLSVQLERTFVAGIWESAMECIADCLFARKHLGIDTPSDTHAALSGIVRNVQGYLQPSPVLTIGASELDFSIARVVVHLNMASTQLMERLGDGICTALCHVQSTAVPEICAAYATESLRRHCESLNSLSRDVAGLSVVHVFLSVLARTVATVSVDTYNLVTQLLSPTCPISHPDVRAAGITLVANFAAHNVNAATMGEVTAILTHFLLPDCPLECRSASVSSLRTVCRSSAAAIAWEGHAELRVKLLMATVAACFDEDSSVRSCGVESAAELLDGCRATVSHSAALALVFGEVKRLSRESSVVRAMVQQHEAMLLDDVGSGDASQNVGEDDALFEVEGANMYAEAPVIRRWFALSR